MDANLFTDESTGELVPIKVEEEGVQVSHIAFAPHPLPTNLELSASTWMNVVNAVEQLGRLDAVASELGVDPVLLSRPTIRREAMSTSALEGTFAPAAEVLTSEVDEDLPRSPAIVEILNFIKATEHGVRRLTELPIGTRLARELQDILIKGTVTDDWQRGEVRKTLVIIGPYKGCSVREATYVPPPPGSILELGLDAWETWIHAESDMHQVVRIAMAHYQFEAIHPFTDGNGRIGRLIAILQLIETGILAQPLINLSPFFEVRSDKYRYLLRQVSITGAWDEWISFFCEALASQAIEAAQRVRELLAWRDTTTNSLRSHRMRGVVVDLAASLIEYPTVNVKQVAERFEVTVTSANTAVNKLVDEGIISEITGGNYNRVFQATDVMRIFFDRR